MKFWWLTEFRRLGEEKRAVELLARDEAWFELGRWCFHDYNFAVVGVIIAHGVRYPVRLLYPDQFPDVPAWVEPQEDVRWSTHQYGSGGILCLELRPDNWVATATGADMLRSAYNLLLTENPLGEGGGQVRAVSAHHIGEIQSYDWNVSRVLINAGCRDRVQDGSATELKALRWMSQDAVWPIMLHDAEDRTSVRHPPEADINTGRWELPVYVTRNVAPALVPDRPSLVEAGGFGPEVATQITASTAALVLFAGGPDLTAFHLFADGEPYRQGVLVLPEQGEVRSGRVPEAATKRVAIIGAGSIGSKIAECLVRSGVSRLTLVDGDVMLPGNLERHALDWRDIGFRKVHGLKRRLLHISPGADIHVVDQNLNWQRSAQTHARQVDSIAKQDRVDPDPSVRVLQGEGLC